MPSHETIDLTTEGSAARILLNRPDALNAWNEQFGDDLRDAVSTVAGDDAVRAVLITGAGRGFSSGADLKEQRGSDEGGLPDLGARLKDVYHPIITELREMPKPVVSAVNGPAVGIGCSLALAADLIVAAESAYFLLAFVNIGLVPDGGSTAFIPARVGYARAAEMAMLGERIPAAKALDWGLINQVVADDELESVSDALLERLANGPTRSYAGSKRLLNRRLYADLAGQLEAEADTQRGQGHSKDFVEGVIAFAEKREPNFTGA
ncbi:MAG: enoyl-CoA hydratase-related protein [Solirubrobacterales bacterium]